MRQRNVGRLDRLRDIGVHIVALGLAATVSAHEDFSQIYDGDHVSIRPISFDPLVESPVVVGTESWSILLPSALGKDYVIMNWGSNPLPPTIVEDMELLDATAVGIYPPASCAVRLPAANVAALAALPGVRWVGPYLPGYRIWPGLVAAASEAPGPLFDMYLCLLEGEDADAAFLANLSGLVNGLIVRRVRPLEEPEGHAGVWVSIPVSELPAAFETLGGIAALETIDLWLPDTPGGEDPTDDEAAWRTRSLEDLRPMSFRTRSCVTDPLSTRFEDMDPLVRWGRNAGLTGPPSIPLDMLRLLPPSRTTRPGAGDRR